MIEDTSRQLLSAYLDDELSSQERAEIERLLENSPEARQELAELETVRELLKQIPRESLPPSFSQHLLSTLPARDDAPKAARRYAALPHSKRWKSLAAVCVAMGIVGVVVQGVLSPPVDNSVPEVAMTEDESREPGVSEALDRVDESTQPMLTSREERGIARNEVVAESHQAAALDRSAADTISPMNVGKDGLATELTNGIRALQKNGENIAVIQVAVSNRQQALGKLRAVLDEWQIANVSSSVNGQLAIFATANEDQVHSAFLGLQNESAIGKFTMADSLELAEIQPNSDAEEDGTAAFQPPAAMAFGAGGGGGSPKPGAAGFGSRARDAKKSAARAARPTANPSAENAPKAPTIEKAEIKRNFAPMKAAPQQAATAEPNSQPAKRKRLTTAGSSLPEGIGDDRFRKNLGQLEDQSKNQDGQSVPLEAGVKKLAAARRKLKLPQPILRELQRQRARLRQDSNNDAREIEDDQPVGNLKIVFVLVEPPAPAAPTATEEPAKP